MKKKEIQARTPLGLYGKLSENSYLDTLLYCNREMTPGSNGFTIYEFKFETQEGRIIKLTVFDLDVLICIENPYKEDIVLDELKEYFEDLKNPTEVSNRHLKSLEDKLIPYGLVVPDSRHPEICVLSDFAKSGKYIATERKVRK